jgi:GntR family transcriptional regulator, phosphonate transport system regulatory protein
MSKDKTNDDREDHGRDGLVTRKRPRWQQIQLTLEQEIRSGIFAPGQRLPTEEELAARFAVHRHTVRHAIERLREKELVRVEQGSGSFVREPAVTYRLGPRTRLTSAVLNVTRKPSRKVLSSARIKADRRTAYALSLPVGHPVRRVEVLRLVDNRPVGASTYFFPMPRFDGIHKLIEETGSITESFRRLGVNHFMRKSLLVKAVLPTLQDSQKLKISRTKPLIELIGTNVDPSGIPIQLSHSRLVSAWLDLMLEFRD